MMGVLLSSLLGLLTVSLAQRLFTRVYFSRVVTARQQVQRLYWAVYCKWLAVLLLGVLCLRGFAVLPVPYLSGWLLAQVGWFLAGAWRSFSLQACPTGREF